MSILARNITKRFGNFTALDDVTVEAPGGKLVALLGPSGSGKTTLLRIIAGLEHPDAGQVLFEGEDATTRSARHRNVGFVFQHYALFRHMSIFENVAFSLRVRKRPEEQVRRRVQELLKLVQLENVGKRYPAQLSGGQRQRVALARALIKEPRILILDDAFASVDAQTEHAIVSGLDEILKDRTVFIISHRVSLLRRTDRIGVLDGGQIVETGTHDELMNRPGIYQKTATLQLSEPDDEALEDILNMMGEMTTSRGNGQER